MVSMSTYTNGQEDFRNEKGSRVPISRTRYQRLIDKHREQDSNTTAIGAILGYGFELIDHVILQAQAAWKMCCGNRPKKFL